MISKIYCDLSSWWVDNLHYDVLEVRDPQMFKKRWCKVSSMICATEWKNSMKYSAVSVYRYAWLTTNYEQAIPVRNHSWPRSVCCEMGRNRRFSRCSWFSSQVLQGAFAHRRGNFRKSLSSLTFPLATPLSSSNPFAALPATQAHSICFSFIGHSVRIIASVQNRRRKVFTREALRLCRGD